MEADTRIRGKKENREQKNPEDFASVTTVREKFAFYRTCFSSCRNDCESGRSDARRSLVASSNDVAALRRAATRKTRNEEYEEEDKEEKEEEEKEEDFCRGYVRR